MTKYNLITKNLTAFMFGVIIIAQSVTQGFFIRFDVPLPTETRPWSQYQIQPAQPTPQFNKFCWYPVRLFVNSNNVPVYSTDTKFFAQDMMLTGFMTGSTFGEYFSLQSAPYYPLTGSSRQGVMVASALGALRDYPQGSQYYYINATVGFGSDGAVQSGDLATIFFRSSGDNVGNAEFIFYYAGSTGDSTNLQSGVQNGFVNLITGLNASLGHVTGIVFETWPCILDTDAPIFTGYPSDQIFNPFTDTFSFGIYDWTGKRDFPYSINPSIINSTIHYWFDGSNYVPAPDDVDNQMGILDSNNNKNFNTVLFSGITYASNAFTGEPGMDERFVVRPLATGKIVIFDFTNSNISKSPYVYSGNIKTWKGSQGGDFWRGATVTHISHADSIYEHIKENQIITVIMTGRDLPNQAGFSNTGFVQFTMTITGFDRIPPYIAEAVYQFTGNDGTTDLGTDNQVRIPAGQKFTIHQITGWTQWTNQDVDLKLTGSEMINIDSSSATNENSNTSDSYLYGTFPSLNLPNTTFTINFTGNRRSGTFLIYDLPPHQGQSFSGGGVQIQQSANTGWTYSTGGTNYKHQFITDIFWIDTADPDIFTGIIENDPRAGTVRLLLTGQNTGLIDYQTVPVLTDDEFVILGFSGYNGFDNNPSIGLDAGYSTGKRSLVHTGLYFTNDREGCVKVRDRANNQICVDISIRLATRVVEVRALPAQRLDSQIYSWTGYARFYQYSGAYWTGGLTTTGSIQGNEFGTGEFVININNPHENRFMFIFKTNQHLSVGFTGEIDRSRATPSEQLFDLTNTDTFAGYQTRQGTGWLRKFDITTMPSLYPAGVEQSLLVPGDVNRNDVIGALDLALINQNLTVGFGAIPDAMDLDKDGFITSRDQAILIQNSNANGFWRYFINQLLQDVSENLEPAARNQQFWTSSDDVFGP